MDKTPWFVVEDASDWEEAKHQVPESARDALEAKLREWGILPAIDKKELN